MEFVLLDEEGQASFDGTRPEIDQVKIKEVVTKADISRDGILAASTSRKLDKAGYRLHDDELVALLQFESPVECGSVITELFTNAPAPLPKGCSSEGAALSLWLQKSGITKVGFLEVYVCGS